MSSVLSTVYDQLNNDPALTELAPGGVHTEWVTEGAELPRVVLGADFAVLPGRRMGGGSMNVDLFVRGNDIELLEEIRDRVIALLEGEVFYSRESGQSLRLFLEADGPSQAPEDRIGHWTMAFTQRFLRERVLKDR